MFMAEGAARGGCDTSMHNKSKASRSLGIMCGKCHSLFKGGLRTCMYIPSFRKVAVSGSYAIDPPVVPRRSCWETTSGHCSGL